MNTFEHYFDQIPRAFFKGKVAVIDTNDKTFTHKLKSYFKNNKYSISFSADLERVQSSGIYLFHKVERVFIPSFDLKEVKEIEKQLLRKGVYKTYNFVNHFNEVHNHRLRTLKSTHKDESLYIIGNSKKISKKESTFFSNVKTLCFNNSFNINKHITPTYLLLNNDEVIDTLALEIIKQDKSPIFIESNKCSRINLDPFDFDQNIFQFKYLDEKIFKGKNDIFSKDIEMGVSKGSGEIFQAMQIAAYLGFSKIVLFGIDHNLSKEQEINITIENNLFFEDCHKEICEITEQCYESVLNYFEKNDISIFNASDSGYEMFEKISLESSIDHKINAPRSSFTIKKPPLKEKMNYLFIGGNNPGFSGGRYHALLMAQALAERNNVTFFTNYVPDYLDEVEENGSGEIDFVLTRGRYKENIETEIDHIVVVPGMEKNHEMYYEALRLKAQKKSTLTLLNFETPNYFNEYSSAFRDPKNWNAWKLISLDSNSIISSTETSQKFAEEFFVEAEMIGSIFDTVNPPLNTRIFREVNELDLKKENKILMFLRFSHSDHKGTYQILDIFNKNMAGYKVVILLGKNDMPKSYQAELDSISKKYNFTYEIKASLDERSKFIEYATSKILLFPSTFEGFGYPPFEALTSNVYPIIFNLPSYKDVIGNFDYIEMGDFSSLKNKFKEALTSLRDKSYQYPNQSALIDKLSFENYEENLCNHFIKLQEELEKIKESEDVDIANIQKIRKEISKVQKNVRNDLNLAAYKNNVESAKQRLGNGDISQLGFYLRKINYFAKFRMKK